MLHADSSSEGQEAADSFFEGQNAADISYEEQDADESSSDRKDTVDISSEGRMLMREASRRRPRGESYKEKVIRRKLQGEGH